MKKIKIKKYEQIKKLDVRLVHAIVQIKDKHIKSLEDEIKFLRMLVKK